ncbi:MAG: hypothetical protein JWR84_2802 [Caulobacter sp.]|nr:hypothetical protein [Caulobacter sp.]
MKSINWIGVVVALIVGQALGFGWYGFLFAEKWMALSGVTAESANSMGMVWGVVQNLVIVVGLAWLVGKTGTNGYVNGAIFGALVCAFFGLGTMALRFIYGHDNTGLIPIDGGYMLLQYILSGAILAGLKLGKPAAA